MSFRFAEGKTGISQGCFQEIPAPVLSRVEAFAGMTKNSQELIMCFRITSASLILALSFIMPFHVISQEDTGMSIKGAKERALIWLRNQKVPNAILPDPQPERRNSS
jgi:hypothetical protein